MISEGLCDTEDRGKDALNKSHFTTHSNT